MNDFFEWFVPCFVTLSIFLMIFSFIGFMRYMRYRETIALAEKGLLRQNETNSNGKGSLRWGVIIAFIGLGLSLGMCPTALFSGTPEFLVAGTFLGLVPMFFGLGLIVSYIILNRNKE